MFFLVLIFLSFSANDYPIIPESYIKGYISPNQNIINELCPAKNNSDQAYYNYNSLIFECEQINQEEYYYSENLYYINESAISIIGNATEDCPSNSMKVLNTCISNTSLDQQYLGICTSLYSDNWLIECKDLLSLFAASKNINIVHQQALQFFANQVVMSDYPPLYTQPWYDFFGQIPITSFQGYSYWINNVPFFGYLSQQQVSINNILDESYITSSFRFSQVFQFYLARYKWNGEFIGFTPLTLQLNKCTHKNDISQIWRKFGTNLKLECFFDLTRDLDEDTNEFYEIFIEDGRNENGIIMRPIPILFNGKIGRRFYKFNNLTSNIKFIDSTKIYFEQLTSNKFSSTIRTPYFEFTTRTVSPSTLSQVNSEIRFKSDSDQHPKFTFESNYIMDFSNFTQICIILMSITGVLAFIVMIVCIISIALSDGKYGDAARCIIKSISAVCQAVGIYFFVVSFSFSFIFLVFYKWQKAIFWCFPNDSFKMFKLVNAFIYVSFAFQLIGILIQVFYTQLFNNFIIMDRETPISEDVPVSAWRRINLSNELNRIISIRSYSVPFTIISAVFILNGFKVELLSTPVPESKLIEISKSHWLLRFAVSAFIWLLLMTIQYLWFHFIYWRFYGNPYFNFLDLCTVSNCSLFITTSNVHGYYLHGRFVQNHSDVDMKELSQALVDEEQGLAGFRGLIQNDTAQVFELFFSRDFSMQYEQMQSELSIHVEHVKRKMSAREVSQEALTLYDQLNTFLRMFIEGTGDNRYAVQPPEPFQKLFRVPPPILNDSVFNKVKDIIYKRSLLAGAEWGMMLAYLLLFCIIDIRHNSPGIAGFTVYLLDFVIVTVYEKLFRLRLAKSSLLDQRFLLS